MGEGPLPQQHGAPPTVSSAAQMQAGGAGARDDDDDSKPQLYDIRTKIESFIKIDNAVRKVSTKGTKLTGYRELAAVLEWAEMQLADSVNDVYREELEAYSKLVKDKAKLFVSTYEDFLAYCENQLATTKTNATPTDNEIDTAATHVTTLLGKITEYELLSKHHQSDQYNMMGSRVQLPTSYQKDLSDQLRNIGQAWSSIRLPTSITSKVLKFAQQSTLLTNHTSSDPSALKAPLENISVVIENARTKAAHARTRRDDAFDPAKSTPEDFVRYHGMGTARSAGIPMMDKNSDNAMAQLEHAASPMALYSKLGRAVVSICRKGRVAIETWMKLNPATAAATSSGSSAAVAPGAQFQQQARAAVDALSNVETKLLMSANAESRIPDLDELVNRHLSDMQFAKAVAGGRLNRIRSSGSGAFRGGPSKSGGVRSPSSGDGSGSGGGRYGDSLMSGFLYRRIDPIRVARYLEQAQRFKDAVDNYKIADFVTMQVSRLKAMSADMDTDVAQVSKRGDAAEAVDMGEIALRTLRLADGKLAMSKSFVRGVRATVASYVRMHRSFVSQRHGDAIRYMLYWKDVGDDAVHDDDVARALDDHAEMLAEIAASARSKLLDEVRKPVLEAALQVFGSAAQLRLNDSQQTLVDARIDELGRWIVEQSERIEDMYLRGTPTLLDALLDPQIVALYVLKALRVGVAWFTLAVASNTFQSMYSHRVHTRDEPPPHPAVFVAMLLGADLAVHLVVLAVMLTLMRVFKTVDNDFPVDGQLIRLWAVDYAIVTAAIGALALIIGTVIRNKKYFRYKYEGDRGIRAMRDLVFYAYCVLTPIPFFRIVFG